MLTDRPRKPNGRGFTLVELLVTISIIGLLSTIATVSYTSVRASSRDTKRVSDVKAIQAALEIYFESNSSYPFDGVAGPDGEILGLPETLTLSDIGFAPEPEGMVYMARVPRNPEPNGSPYVYRSLYRNGRDCNDPKCDAYAVLFTLEKASGAWLAGPHALTTQGLAGAEGGTAGAGVTSAGGEIVGLAGAQAALMQFADQATTTVTDFVNDPTVKEVTEVAVAPTAAAAAVANTAIAAQATTSVAATQYLFFFLTQPILMLRRRRRRSWGVIYNSLSRLPEDLVIVRLRNGDNNRVIKSDVTDKDGRFSFIVPAGRYRLEASKVKFVFPSKITAELKEDGQYIDLYHGEVIEVGAEGAVLTPNIPMDPAEDSESDAAIVKKDRWRKLQTQIAFVGPALGALSLVIKPSLFVGLLFLLQIFLYMFFRRFAAPVSPKNWGIVYDESTGRSVVSAVLRVFALPYHKLLDTKVSDSRGRYNFRVGNSKYYLTVTKAGYLKTESEPVDFTGTTEPMFIAADIPLRNAALAAAESAEAQLRAPAPERPASQPTAAAPTAAQPPVVPPAAPAALSIQPPAAQPPAATGAVPTAPAAPPPAAARQPQPPKQP